jgi:hypothetical protein
MASSSSVPVVPTGFERLAPFILFDDVRASKHKLFKPALSADDIERACVNFESLPPSFAAIKWLRVSYTQKLLLKWSEVVKSLAGLDGIDASDLEGGDMHHLLADFSYADRCRMYGWLCNALGRQCWCYRTLKVIGVSHELLVCDGLKRSTLILDTHFKDLKPMPELSITGLVDMIIAFKNAMGVETEVNTVPHMKWAPPPLLGTPLGIRLWYWVLMVHTFGLSSFKLSDFVMFWSTLGVHDD